jgi:hypothetical protein
MLHATEGKMMNHAAVGHTDKSFRVESTCNSDARFPGLHSLPKPFWRDALSALAAPAVRMHQYRNLHRLMFYDAICQIDDCKAKQ